MTEQTGRVGKATIFLRVPEPIKSQFTEYAGSLGLSENTAGTLILVEALKRAGYPGLTGSHPEEK